MHPQKKFHLMFSVVMGAMMISLMTTPYIPPEWAFEFHGHRYPLMALDYRMGRLTMDRLGVEGENRGHANTTRSHRQP